MKNLTAKYLSLLLLASLFSGYAQADSGYVNGGDCCMRQYECGCNPLYCGAWDLQVQAGVNPIVWTKRGEFLGINCGSSVTDPVVVLFETPKFNKLFKTPWIVGGQIGYQWSDNARLYLEFNYSQAKGKDAVVLATAITGFSLTNSLNKYKIFDAYVGVRYYWDRWCDSVSFFLGGKIGITHHKGINNALVTTFNSITVPFTFETFNRHTVVAGGVNFGLDYCICGNWSLVLTGEVVASCGPRAARFHITDQRLPITDLLVGGIGTELRFPITLGVRYSF